MKIARRWSHSLVLVLLLGACSGSDDDDDSAEVATTCAPPHGTGTDPCVEIGPGEPLRLAAMLDDTSIIRETGVIALAPSIGVDDRRGTEVARVLRPQALGHTIELVGSADMNVGTATAAKMVKNYRENCNNLDSMLARNEDTAKAIVDDGKILGVVGPICSNSVAQVERVLTLGKVVVISPNAQSPALTATCPEPQTTPATPCRPADSYLFRTSPNGQFQAQVVADHAKKAGYKSAATVDDASLFSHGVAVSFAAQVGLTTPNHSPVTTADQMDAAIAALAASPPDIVYVTNTSLAQTRTFVQKARDGVSPDLPAGTVIATTNAVLSKSFWEPAEGGIGVKANGVLASSMNMAFTSSTSYTSAFMSAYKSVSGGEAPINFFHAHAVDAYDLIVDGIEKVALKKGDRLLIPRGALRAAVAGANRKGLTSIGEGKLSCASGDCTPGATAYMVDELRCPPASGPGTCNMVQQPIP